ALAAAAGIRQGYLSEIERGAKTPSLATARALARALEVDLELLLPDEG
ncbi:MAG: helix-turn-helix domain-containing protein, partial [Proteobacteria bacterium]|nr:helix-turn-helix domain-containing protein [Pseudomonadota bacterium]